MRWLLKLPLGVLVLALASDVVAQTPVRLTISGNEAEGSFELPGGIVGDLSISFERVLGLNEDALDVSARLVDPLDSAILSRLPGPDVSLPQAFSVLIRIEPTPSSGLTFSGIVSVSLHTHNLVLAANSPLALYSGPVGGPLRDITRAVGLGSYRAGGSGGGFSEFMIVADARPIDTIIAEKFDVLEAQLADDLGRVTQEISAITSDSARTRALGRVDTVSELQRRSSQARTLYGTGATTSAIAEVTGLLDYMKIKSGFAIPDVWRAHDSRVNVVGLRRAAAETLRFSLVKAALPGPQVLPPPPSPDPTPPPP
jgi:hypothetical protein